MSKKDGLSFDGLQEWQQWLLQQADGNRVNQMKSRIVRTLGLRMQEYLHDLTPVKSGALGQSMLMDKPGNVFDMKVGKSTYVVVGTNIEYAQHVNDGFTQKAGRFVPGMWRGKTFHYIPGHDSGMVLTGKVIEGAHMFEKAMQYIEDDVPTVVEFEFRRLYAELIGG